MIPVQRVLIQGERIRVEQLAHGVIRLLLTRPEHRNAFDGAMAAEMTKALVELAGFPASDLRVLVLAGEGKVFCAGADLAYMRLQAEQTMDENLADARRLGELFHHLAAFPVPVLCGIQGAAIGGGFGLAACADVVVAEANAAFALSEVRLGIVPAVISPFVVRKLGYSQAVPWMLSGRRQGALEAKASGLVHEIVSPESSLEAALEGYLAELLQAGPEASRRTKALLLREVPLPDPELAEFTACSIAEARSTTEAQTGLQTFFSKTPAPWAVRL